MDGNRFDSFARAFAGATSRRAAFVGVVAALLPLAGSVGAARRRDEDGRGPAADACLANGQRCGKGSGKRGKPCRKCCSRHSVMQGNGRRRCACKPEGVACGNAAQCCSGRRTAASVCGACAAGFGDCPAGCVELETDDRNCGACGVACAAGEVCLGGGCTACGGAGQPCCAEEACDRGRTCQGGTCLLPASQCDPNQPACDQQTTLCARDCRCATSMAGETFCRGIMYCRGDECTRDEDCLDEPGLICMRGCDRSCCARVCSD